MRRLALLLAAALAALAAPAAAWDDCAAAGALFKVGDVSLSPQPVHPGDIAEFVISAASSELKQLAAAATGAGAGVEAMSGEETSSAPQLTVAEAWRGWGSCFVV